MPIKSHYRRAIALALLIAPAMAHAQSKPVAAPGSFVPQGAIAYGASGAVATPVTPTSPLPVMTRGESFQLITANASAPAAGLVGGAYVFTQLCTGYGTVTLRYRGPDGATMIALLSKTAADSGGGTILSFGSNAIVDVTVSGTTGCNATLAKMP